MVLAANCTSLYTSHTFFSSVPLSAGRSDACLLLTPNSRNNQLNNGHLLEQVTHLPRLGARRWTRFTIPRPFTGIISSNRRFVRLGVRRRRWLLPPLVRTSFPDPVRRKRLDVALCVFSLYLPDVGFRGTVILLLLFSGLRGDKHVAP